MGSLSYWESYQPTSVTEGFARYSPGIFFGQVLGCEEAMRGMAFFS
jgi:hypothetical protein